MALQRWPSHRLSMTLFGQGIAVLALVVASFANNVTELIFTQGAMYGIGGAFLYNPFVFYLDEWFIERKGLAFGILWAGTGISGSIVPLVMEWGLEKFGFRSMLRICAAVLVWRYCSRCLATCPLTYLDIVCHSVDSRGQATATYLEEYCTSTAPRLLSKYHILDFPDWQRA